MAGKKAAPKFNKKDTKGSKTVVKVTQEKKKSNPLFKSTPRSFRIGGDIQPTRDLSRFVRWPRYVRLQRQRRILYQRLKTPPSINQFTNTLDKNLAADLFRVLLKYQPETKIAKTKRIRDLAEAKVAGKEKTSTPPAVVKYGLNHVTSLIESKKAKLVVIAHDVNPIELVVFLPALCRKMDVPYCIVKGKSRLGQLVHKKNAAVVCLTQVNKEDKNKVDNLASTFRTQYNNNKDALRQWGGGIMGLKTQKRLEKREQAVAAEAAKKAQF